MTAVLSQVSLALFQVVIVNSLDWWESDKKGGLDEPEGGAEKYGKKSVLGESRTRDLRMSEHCCS